MIMQNSLDSLIIKRGCICRGLQALNCRCLRTEHGPMDHKAGIFGGAPEVGAQVSNDSYRGNTASIIQMNIHRRGTEDIVDTNAVSNISADGLEHQIYFVHALLGRNRYCVG